MHETIVKKGVRAGVDKNGVPTNWVWEVDRMVTFDDGTVSIVSAAIAFTDEELATHVSAALAAQQADLLADAQERDALKAERDAALIETTRLEREKAALAQERDALMAASESVN